MSLQASRLKTRLIKQNCIIFNKKFDYLFNILPHTKVARLDNIAFFQSFGNVPSPNIDEN